MPSSTRRWSLTLLLALGAAINYGDRAAMSSALSPLKDDLHLSDAALGVIASMFLWAYALCSPFAGSLADRFSRTKLANFSLVAWSILMALTGCANGIVSLCALRLGLGVAESAYLPASIALVGDYHPPATRARGMSVLILGMSLGVIAGGALAGLIAHQYGWRAVFWTFGATGALYGLLCIAVFKRVPSPTAQSEERPSLKESIHYLSRVPSYYVLLSKVMLAGVSLWIFFSWLPLYFHEVFKLSVGSAGLAGNLIPELASVLGFATGGWISDLVARRNTRHRMLIQGLAYLAATPFLLLFLGRPSFTVVSVALLCFGYIRTLGDANEQSILCEIVPPRFRATAVGFMNMGATTAGGVGVLLAGYLKQNVGLSTVFAASSVLFLTAGCALIMGYVVLVPRDIARAAQYTPHTGS